jgi:hypothetical protein
MPSRTLRRVEGRRFTFASDAYLAYWRKSSCGSTNRSPIVWPGGVGISAGFQLAHSLDPGQELLTVVLIRDRDRAELARYIHRPLDGAAAPAPNLGRRTCSRSATDQMNAAWFLETPRSYGPPP